MGWFDKQIREIKESDQEAFEDSIFRMATVILGSRDSGTAEDDRILTKAAVDEIVKYYHFKPVEVPAQVKDADEALEYSLRPCGIMRRNITLSEGWYKDSFGPILAYRKEDGHPIALIPGKFIGYTYIDPTDGRKIKVTGANAAALKDEAICFYRPLPLKPLTIGDLIVYIKGCFSTSDISVTFLLTLLVVLMGMITPQATRILTGTVLGSGNNYFLVGIAGFMVAAAISSMLVTSVNSLCLNRLQTKVSVSVEAALMSRVMNLPARFFKEYSSGDLFTRLTSAQQLCTLIMGSVFSAGLTSLFSLLYIGQIISFAPGLVLPALFTILATVAVNMIASLMQMKTTRASMEASAATQGISIALINGIQKIKVSGAEKRSFARWAEGYSKEARYTYDPPVFFDPVRTAGFTTAIAAVGTILMYYMAVTTNVSPSEYIAFNTAYGAVMGAFTSLVGMAQSITRIKPALDMAEPILSAIPESSENKSLVTSLTGNIEMNNIYFRYKDSAPYVINGLNLKIKSGEYIAIVGTTGCGKSTLMRLLLGFETPEKGAIYYDGRDMSKLDLKSLRSRIGAVTQDGGLFQGDIFSNIVISAPQLTMDEAWEAAQMAGIADDIRAMPMGMNTIISEGQGGISGGQRQRLMIARAIAPKPKILMFDEATSALDNKTQKQVSDALDGLKCTRIVIAHRLSTIKHCDRILMLDKGNIVESGTYDELIEKGGRFAELVERQRLES